MTLTLEAQRLRTRDHLRESSMMLARLAEGECDDILISAAMLADCFRTGNKVLLCGNGGSAADCQHFAAELVSCLTQDFKRPGLPAIALTTDSSFLTAYANDFGFDGIFERQVRVLGKTGDLLICISTSGNSMKVGLAVGAARELGLKTLGLVGEGGSLASQVDHAIVVPSHRTQTVQEALLAIEHIVCDITERILFA